MNILAMAYAIFVGVELLQTIEVGYLNYFRRWFSELRLFV